MSYVLGIDLGTTNTVVAVAEETEVRVLRNQEGNLLLPSVVSFHPDGSVLIGEGARERRLIDAENTVYSVKRLIGRQFRSPEVQRAKERFAFPLAEGPSGGVRVQVRGETYTLTEISAFVLRKAREQAEIALGDKAQQAVITVPANFNELQRSATKAAGLVAGLEVLRIINEPTAAALAYGCGKGTRERIAIYDLGGGTFDLTILDLDRDVFEVLSTAGDTFLGGDDFDVALADKMADAFLSTHNWDPRQDRQAFERLRAAAEWAKCRLSEDTEVELTIEELAYGPGGQPLDLTWSTTRKDLEDLIHPTVGRSFDVCNDAFKLAALKPQDLDKVILVGGSTRIPLVKRMVTEFFGKQPLVDIDPDLVVAQGAAIHARAIAGVPKGRQRRKSLGKVALKRVSGSQLRPAAAEEMDRPKQPAFAPTPAAHAPPPVARAPIAPPVPPPRARKASGRRTSKGINERITPPPSAVVEPPLVALDDSSDNIGDFQESKTGVFGPEVLTGMGPKVEDGPSVIVDQQLLDPKRTAKMGSEGSAISRVKTDPGHVAKIQPVVLRDPNPRSNPPPPAPGAAAPPPPPPAAIPSALISPDPMPAAAPISVDRRPIAPSSPLLMDVTPHSLGIETTGGYCQLIIHRNAPVPTEQMRVFTTARDNQEVVFARICQGESRRFEENETLGQLELHNLRSATRGEVKIEVAFMLDASGTLDVRATDVGTGQAQSVRINLLGGTSNDELDQMRSRQEAAMTR